MAENVRVAVRVRPFNSREKARDAKLIIDMQGTTTTIKDPSMPDNVEPRKFAFDYSYWSHDGFKERSDGYLEPTEERYADQSRVFSDLGRGVLDNAWKGYNCSLFAYGQTGSGKSYSMVGYGTNKGIVPVTCEELFKGIDEKGESSGVEYQVALSMLEIYNEQVRDLLNFQMKQKGGLKVRENPKKGFYVDGLLTVPVKSYAEIDQRINEGTRNRTVASTNMNATSSRAHTVVAITFKQKGKNEAGQETTKVSTINLVDLAGSERAESTGATGDRLKEGSAINQSLSTLGNVIKALADISGGKKGVLVPYRDSVLTKLLKNALGGNSKTIMIAALSPADINYEETLSTLRFANRAKSIKTQAVVNESPTEKLIRELREENRRLMDQLKAGGVVTVVQEVTSTSPTPASLTEEEKEQMKQEYKEELARTMAENEKELNGMELSWKQKLAEAEQMFKSRDQEESRKKEERLCRPHLWNLNEDPQLTNMVHHILEQGSQKIGNNKADPPADIVLIGLSIQKDHATVFNDDDIKLVLQPGPDAKVLLNGEMVTMETALHHNDRVLFGSNHLYVVHHPKDVDVAAKVADTPPEAITYDLAQAEIAKNSGFDMDVEGKSKEDLLIMEDLMTILPMINEANAISQELDKKVKFEVALISPQARGLAKGKGRTEVYVKMKSLLNDGEWLWSRNQFLNRKFLMQEMYQKYVDNEDWDKPPETDPFFESLNQPKQIGAVHVYLQSLTYMLDLDENLSITNYQGNEEGRLQIMAVPCQADGKEPSDEEDDLFVDDPNELINRRMDFNLKLPFARGINAKYTQDVFCRYKFFLEDNYRTTKKLSGTSNPDFNYIEQITCEVVTSQIIDMLALQPLVIEVWATPKFDSPKDGTGKSLKTSLMSTKDLMADDILRRSGSSLSRVPDLFMSAEEKYQLTCEIAALTRRNNRLMSKLEKVRQLVKEAKAEEHDTVEVTKLDAVLSTRRHFRAAAQAVILTSKANSPSKACVVM